MKKGYPEGRAGSFSAGVVSCENFRKVVIEQEAIPLTAASLIPMLATEQKIKHPALPKVTR